MSQQQASSVHLLAGQRPDGDLIFEDVPAKAVGDSCYQLLQSPAFARGCAKDDVIRLLAAGRFEVEQHNGNLCVRVLARENIDVLKQRLSAPLKALDAQLDLENQRTLVYSIPVQSGFTAVEKAFNEALQGYDDNAIWLYANVYDPMDGETPLNWWHDFLAK